VIRDITFSGDGEPTAYPHFAEACRLAAELRLAHGLNEARLIVHTDSSLLHREAVREGLRVLDANNGEVWAKLDAGTEAYYQRINRTVVPFKRILENLAMAGRERDLVVQSLFMEIDGEPLPDAEFEAYMERLSELVTGGCRIRLVQVYTVARLTAVKSVRALPREHLDRMVAALRARFPAMTTEAYYGAQ
jgi:wyosine [tRNA(Phe)-imidazoG37] synthetase (radical SAM superfamily)